MNKLFKSTSIIMLIFLAAMTVLYFVSGRYYPVSAIAVILFIVSVAAAKSKNR